MPEREDDGALPATFGKYFLTEKLATGGMAEIYLGKLIGPGGFEKQLVIKQIHPKLSGQRHFVDLFVAEAKTLVTLAHGNIVPVYELGVIDDTYFIAMEYIDGPTLYRLTETLRRRGARMEPPLAAWITARILEGLAYAHRKGDGVIHRDLSPRNVMLSRDGEVKLVDFGIAVTLGAAGEDDTGQSAPTGSFPYMSPEQVRKEPLTVQTDLFTVGVLCWEMLVGHRLFARPDPDATLHAVIDGDIPRPSAENPEIPARLDDVVMRALERDMTARWTSADDMVAALQRYLYSLDPTPGPRDLAALVARYCPPETRRLPTHHDLPEPDGPLARAATASIDDPADDADLDPPRPGPMTAVIPRDGSKPRGKRSTRARTETFATHVALEEILERAAPSADAEHDGTTGDGDDAPSPGDRDDPTPVRPRPSAQSAAQPAPSEPATTGDRDDPTPVRPRPSAQSAAQPATPSEPAASPTTTPADDDAPIPRPERPPFQLQLPGRTAPSNSLLILASLGAIGLGAASLVVFYQGRSAVERPDAGIKRDARFDDLAAPDAPNVTDANPTGSPDTTPDAADAPPPSPDATTPIDATPAVPQIALDAHPADPHHDAGTRPNPPRPDASTTTTAPPDAAPAIDATTHPTGTATITIGANPWGDVTLDGKTLGHTPIEKLSIPAGHHTIKVTFGGEDPPRTLSYTIDLANGDTRDLLADFTKPP